MNRKLQALAVLATALVLAAPVMARAANDDIVAEGRFERSLKVTGPVELDVKTGWGSIAVRAGDASTVRVVGRIKVRKYSRAEAEEKVRVLEANPPIEQHGNAIRIGHIEDREVRERVGISYELMVPAATRVHSQTGSGSQTIEGIQGPLEASTGSGSVTVGEVGGETRLSTGSGTIRARNIKGGLRANTGSGSIHGTGIGGAIVASTGSGSIELEQIAAGSIEASTGSGGVEIMGAQGALRVRTGSGSIRAQGEPTAGWSLRTSSGSITVRLPQSLAFDLDAETSSGRVYTAHPITIEGGITPRRVRGKVRGGGMLIDLSTSSGSIHVE
jgi:hypothetical protein